MIYGGNMLQNVHVLELNLLFSVFISSLQEDFLSGKCFLHKINTMITPVFHINTAYIL